MSSCYLKKQALQISGKRTDCSAYGTGISGYPNGKENNTNTFCTSQKIISRLIQLKLSEKKLRECLYELRIGEDFFNGQTFFTGKKMYG